MAIQCRRAGVFCTQWIFIWTQVHSRLAQMVQRKNTQTVHTRGIVLCCNADSHEIRLQRACETLELRVVSS